jgi:hypothetical protein
MAGGTQCFHQLQEPKNCHIQNEVIYLSILQAAGSTRGEREVETAEQILLPRRLVMVLNTIKQFLDQSC